LKAGSRVPMAEIVVSVIRAHVLFNERVVTLVCIDDAAFSFHGVL